MNPGDRTSRSDVETAILGPHIPHGNEDDIYDGPHSQASKAEELSNALPPQPQVEAVNTKPAQCNAAQTQIQDSGLDSIRFLYCHLYKLQNCFFLNIHIHAQITEKQKHKHAHTFTCTL